jgi:hypothetical protein
MTAKGVTGTEAVKEIEVQLAKSSRREDESRSWSRGRRRRGRRWNDAAVADEAV